MQTPFDHAHLSTTIRLFRSERFEPDDPTALQGVRQLVKESCQAIKLDFDDPVLIACELATNALRHAGTPYRVTFVALWNRLPWIEVMDRSTDLPKPRLAGTYDTGGRGFELITELTASWHWDLNPVDRYKIVCATLKGDFDESGGQHVHTALPAGQLSAPPGPDRRRRTLPVAVPRSA
ncbi:ATP-binding protein [Streptomyces sp. FH025]|uniref:ATP-binding protein n=1 Tax=Streptomyces sp. FH025 TaxID=2815937 RepID=UPI001A9E9916|nr:ATP-binding protein [Streptomyces sp. FH025]MBO1419245.1 ATP-binding protein [Streptomyces sp. FH025]